MKTFARCYCAGLPLVPRTPGVAVGASSREAAEHANEAVPPFLAGGYSPSEGSPLPLRGNLRRIAQQAPPVGRR
jgi:hypothetical protein